jgi:hypothetical protein
METRVYEFLCAMGRFLLPSSCRMRLLISLIVLTASVGLTGCGPRRVRADFTGYEKSYANTSNREVLLNLARLQQHDPTYFFKLGQISSTYQVQAGLSGFGQYVPQGTAPGGANVTGGGTPTAGYQNYSAFNFVPVSDEANARLLLSPVPSEVFYDLYYQGWRVDQLFRLMVDRIELTLPANSDGTKCKVRIIRNAPPPVFRGGGDPIHYEHEQDAIADYVTFLRVSAIVYALQKYGLLQLRGAAQFEPVDKNSFIAAKTNPSDAKSAGEQTVQVPGHQKVVVIMPAEKPETGGNSAAPTAKEFDDAAAKGQVWELRTMPDDTNRWVLGQLANFLEFQLTSSPLAETPPAEATFGANVNETDKQLRTEIIPKDESLETKDPNGESLHTLESAPEIMDILEILYRGFAIEVPSAEEQNQQGVCPKDWTEGAPSRLVMRSLIGVMAAAAQEQEAFDQLKKDNKPLKLTKGNPLYEIMTETHKGLTILDNLALQKASALALKKGAPVNPSQVDPQCDYGNSSPPQDGAVKRNKCYDTMMSALEANQQATFNELVPSIEQLPVLRLNWAHPDPSSPGGYPPPMATSKELKDPGLSLNYQGRDYLVTDVDLANLGKTGYAREDQDWNRDMFRLINELSSQVTVDISKFPLPAILQLPIQ